MGTTGTGWIRGLGIVLVISAMIAGPMSSRAATRGHPHRHAAASAAASPKALVEHVILAQLSAFNHQDYGMALRYASSDFIGVPPEAFADLVTQSYPEMASSKSSKFKDFTLSPNHLAATQDVLVTGKDGKTVDELYDLVSENGNWRIAGVATQRDPLDNSDEKTISV
jgi:hypothetical protein